MSETKTKIKRAPRISDEATIHMSKDESGKLFGTDNNPKRSGSKTHGRFQKYKDGMSVKDAKAAGLTAGDITYDRAHGYISVKPPAASEEKKAA